MPKRAQDKDGLGRGVPTGTVFPFAGSTAPDGWLLCNGSVYAQDTYKRLYAVLSTTWNTTTNQLTGSAYASPGAGNFRVPDLRGTFLRGTVSGSTLHPTNVTLSVSQTNKTKKNGITASAGSSSVSGNGGSISVSSSAASNGVTHNHSVMRIYSGLGISTGGNNSSSGNTFTDSTGNSGTDHSHTITSSVASNSIAGTLTANAQTITVGAGDNETVPNYTGIQYIIKF